MTAPRPTSATQPLRGQLARATLLQRLASGEVTAALSFAGQGADALPELEALLVGQPQQIGQLGVAEDALREIAQSSAAQQLGAYRHGVDLGDWVRDPSLAPPELDRRAPELSYPLILTGQLLLWNSLATAGLGEALQQGRTPLAAGHSQGLLAALAISEALQTPGGVISDALLARYVRLAAVLGLQLSEAARDVPGGASDQQTPMLSIRGVERALLDEVLSAHPQVQLAIVHGSKAVVLGGTTQALAALQRALEQLAADQAQAAKDGKLGGAPLQPILEPLAVAAPFHTDLLASAADGFAAWLDGPGAADAPRRGALDVLSPLTGTPLVGDAEIREALLLGQCSGQPLRWDRNIETLRTENPDWVLDLGPGTGVARLTGELLRGTGIRTLPLASPDARRVLQTPGSHPQDRDLTYTDFVPGLVELPGDRIVVDTAFTRLHGAPPVILAGMTPTTIDAGIVAAAANAGFVAELAGGGQPDEGIFNERIKELRELLEPGREVAFNTLLLDRHLWSLHVEDAALLTRARAAGAPLSGLTVSAGIPEVEAAVQLLDQLTAAGLHRNAFKPGTVAQIRQVLAIARAAPHHTITMHVEGGQGGGHHSWLDLEHLLLATYDEIRQRENVVLAVGGGIGTPERAADFLTGRWSLRRGEPVPMPVDAVLIGTAAMACAEATASPAVKQSLVDAQGIDGWVQRNDVVGGVTSATSNLNADIHLLENPAARAGKLLQQVAGDPDAVQARREEIIAALAPTAKPYLGDLDAMTYLGALTALTERFAIGRHGRYDDGAWGHPNWRARLLEIARRFAARLDPAEQGPVKPPLAVPADLDDPQAALEAFAARYPHAATTLLHPADRDQILEVCDRPGKPVPFVPVLDGEVRRWFMADALWQAQDDRFRADEVFVIPGPVSVAGIARADEPVADLLERFHAATIAALVERGITPHTRDRLAGTGGAPEPLGSVAAAHHGPLASVLATGALRGDDGDQVPNPLWSLVRPGDVLDVDAEDGELTELSAAPAAGEGERVVLRSTADGRAELSIAIPSPDGEPATLSFELVQDGAAWRVPGAGAARAAFAAAALGGHGGEAGRWQCDPALASAYARATGASPSTTLPDLAFTLAWPSIVTLLTSDRQLAPRLAELVHAEHRVELSDAWAGVRGRAGTTDAWISAIDDVDGGASSVTLHAELTADDADAPIATVVTRLVFAGPAPLGPDRSLRRSRIDQQLTLTAASAAVLGELPGIEFVDGTPAAGSPLRITAEFVSTGSHAEPARTIHRVTSGAQLESDGTPVATLASEIEEPTAPGTPLEHPLARLVAALKPAEPRATPGDRTLLASVEDAAPLDLSTFARVGGDANPLHRSVLTARLAGLDAPIVHGAWLAARASAAVIEQAAGGRSEALRSWQVQFLAPVSLGEVLEFELRSLGRRDGRALVEVVVSGAGGPVARGHAELDLATAQRRALLFPGQGIQRAGMAAGLLERSRAARRTWEAADAHCAAELGFSLKTIESANPRTLRLADGSTLSHPSGLLMRTEFTQPALVALAAAQLSALTESGALPAHARIPAAVGHSVGEFSALHALGVLTLEQALTLVHRRGQAMQRHVPRDAAGASPYRMAVVDPRAMGLSHEELLPALTAVGPGVEIVNENARNRQYSVVGKVGGIEAIAAAWPARDDVHPVRVLAAIDVPFHSSVLRPAAAELLEVLEGVIGAVDPTDVVGRWIPNLTGAPFSLSDESSAQLVAAAALETRPLSDLPPAGDASGRARWLLITALAGQLAAPVRWIDTMEALIATSADGGLARETLIEVSPAHASVLGGLARSGGIASRAAVLHSEVDAGRLDRLTSVGAAPSAPSETISSAGGGTAGSTIGSTAASATPAQATQASPTPPPLPSPAAAQASAGDQASPSARGIDSAADTADLQALPGIDAGVALELVLALQARIRLDQLPRGATLDELFQGVSSRRNQVLIDLGREFSLTGAEGAQQRTIGELTEQLRAEGAAYRYPGDYLRVAIDSALSTGLGNSGLARSAAAEQLQSLLGVPPRFAELVLAELALDLREGTSTRGGTLAPAGVARPTTRPAALELLDAAARRTAARAGVALPTAPAAGAGAEQAAAPALSSEATEALQRVAADLLAALGGEAPAPEASEQTESAAALTRLDQLESELGDDLAAALKPAFDARRHVRIDDAWAHARWDLIDAVHRAQRGDSGDSETASELERLAPFGQLESIADTARWLHDQLETDPATPPQLLASLTLVFAANAPVIPLTPRGSRPETMIAASGVPQPIEVDEPSRPGDLPQQLTIANEVLRDQVRSELAQALTTAPDLSHEIALVTGAAPGSIGEAVIAQLLRGGATVIATASALTAARRAWAVELYRRSAAPGAALHLLPANLATTTDIDALVDWLATPEIVQRQRPDLALPSLLPTLVFPLAAISTDGEAGASSAADTQALRLQVTGVHRLLAQLAARAAPGVKTSVLLPLSPNHGTFGDDGIYGETKAALEVLLQRAGTGEEWTKSTAIVAARIGWVRGTGLMQGAGLVAGAVEQRLGIRTFSTDETGLLLTTLLTGSAREAALAGAPVLAEATGGLSPDRPLRPELAPLIAELQGHASDLSRTAQLREAIMPLTHSSEDSGQVQALPSPPTDTAAGVDRTLAAANAWPKRPSASLDQLVAIAGTGELGPVGSARTRWAIEQQAEPSPGAVAELAWLCGLVRYERAGYRGRWIDEASGDPVAEHEVTARYSDAVRERTGLRPLEQDAALDPAGLQQLAPLVAAREAVLTVESPEQAAPFLTASSQASLRQSPSGSWEVVLPAGTSLRLPRQIEHSRRVAGQLPRGLDLARLGAPADLVATADRMALVDLLCTVEAFTDAGLDPGELLSHVHPTQIASTQGAGLGGLASLRRLLLDQLLAETRQTDRIQESLGNVVAAHVVQAFVGSYGPMLHPVGACATAAVSLEAGRDLILAGKALAVVAGGFDDLTAEGLTGFGDMGATASSDDFDAMGIEPGEASRPGDLRRRGFVEAQGGGAQLLIRGDLAVALGLPVRGVLVWAGSFADGLQTSIPAPGLGLLGAAAGGTKSPLAKALAAHGLSADEIGVVSKHDTSTEMNDPGEADLHHRIQVALGRTPGNPLPVVSQKSLTGHSKGGAAAWQVDGALRVLESGVIPGNRSLESADPLIAKASTLAVGRRTIRTAEQLPLRAALVSSLGFGHISALVALAHPAALVAAIDDRSERERYLRRAGRRRALGQRRLLAARFGEPLTTRRPAPAAATRDRDAEAAMLLAAPPTLPSADEIDASTAQDQNDHGSEA